MKSTMHLTSRLQQLLLIAALAACGASTALAFGRNDTAPASVSGVNYTDQDIRYMLFDPKDEKRKVVAAENIGPFAAGGVMCCYVLPKTWQAGTQVGVLLDVFDEKLDDYLPRQTFIVDLPPYDMSGKAGDVWFIRYPDGAVGVVSTAFRPNGDEWPGKIKGWPKPSVDYQRKLWERDMRLAQSSLDADIRSMNELNSDPRAYLKGVWEFHLDNVKNKRIGLTKRYEQFYGPDDPALLKFERDQLEKLLKFSRDKLDHLLKVKP